MRRLHVLGAMWAILLPLTLRAALPLVHEPCANPAAAAGCPTCFVVVHPTVALLPAPADVPRPALEGTLAAAEPPSPPTFPIRLPPPTRGPPAA